MVLSSFKKSNAMQDEAGIIHFLKAAFPEHIGDDAAVLPLTSDTRLVITHDLLVEDVHFRQRYQDAASLAHKALQVNLSDVAAMGAMPLYVLLGLSIPRTDSNNIDAFLTHFTTACKKSKVTLIGGDTTRSPDAFFISVTAIGSLQEKHIKYRHTAQAGDIICVAGQLGDAHLGFTALEQNEPGFNDFKTCFLKPNARINEGLWFGTQNPVTAMMDISDGLFTDLEKLAQASQLGATIHLEKLNPTPEFQAACQHFNLDPITTQLSGGEDYGLLLTVKAQNYPSFAEAFQTRFQYPLKPIGYMHAGDGVQLIKNNQPIHIQLDLFSHF